MNRVLRYCGYYTTLWLFLFFFGKVLVWFIFGLYFFLPPYTFFGLLLFVFLPIALSENRLLGISAESNDDTDFPILGLTAVLLAVGSILYWDPTICRTYMEHDGVRSFEEFPFSDEAKFYGEKLKERCYEQGAIANFGGFYNTFNGWILAIVGGAVGVFFGMLAFTFLSGRLSRNSFSKNKTHKTSKGPRRAGANSASREVIGGDSDEDVDMFIFCLANVDDIISRNKISKGDYTTWFGRCADNYIKDYPAYATDYPKEEIIGKLNWAIEMIPTVYTGNSSDTGKKREVYLKKRIASIESQKIQ